MINISLLRANTHNATKQVALLHFVGFLALVSFIITLPNRWITVDDAWFAEQAYWFAKLGFVRSELFEGILNYEERQFVYHKLHIWQGALITKLFGWGPYFFKAIGLGYILILLGSVYYYLKTQLQSRNDVWLIFFILFFFNSLVVQHGFEYRPDIMMMSTGFLSYLFLRKAMTQRRIVFIISSGLLAGITMLFHLNGVIFIAAGASLLLLYKEHRYLPIFTMASLVGISPYLYEIINPVHFNTFLHQFLNDPALSEDEFSILGWLKKLLLEPKRYFHHVYDSLMFILFASLIWLNWKKVRQHTELNTILLYFGLLTLFVAIVSPGSKTVYLLYTMPYLLILVSTLLIPTLTTRKRQNIFITLCLLYIATNLGHSYSISQKQNAETIAQHQDIAQKYEFSKNDKIMAPIIFVFNQMGQVQIQSYISYLIKYHNEDTPLYGDAFFEQFIAGKKSFVLLSPPMLEDLQLEPVLGKHYADYQYIAKEQDLYIFKYSPIHLSTP